MSAAAGGSRIGATGTYAPLDVEAFGREIASPATPPAESWCPWIVRLSAGEFDRFADLCREYHLTLVDTIDRQLMDLAAVRLPSSGGAERQRFVEATVAANGGRDVYGNWVYLPWETKVVHLLGRDAYFEVITNRNHDKITREEQRLLRTRRIGVIGLSVGGEAAVTVAQEHLCGAIVLADFDRLDLSNLNRLNAGFDDLGVKKAVIVARRIARIDPYLEVTIFEEGVTETNAEGFLDGLDLLIEECDGLRMKHEVRRLAKERGLNVVFAADERGFLSVEPYAYRSDMRPFHGRIEAPQPPRDAFPTPLAFMRALTEWMGGWDRISEVSRRSLEQIGTTLCGYPQLASEARYAAGQIGHVARRLLLGERLSPFVGNVDLAELLPSDREPESTGITHLSPEQRMEFTRIEPFLEYYERLRRRTLRVVDCIPTERLEWAPRPGAFSFGDLLRHVGAIERYVFAENANGRPSRYPGHGRELADGYDAVRAFFERMHRETLDLLRSLDPEDLRRRCETPGGASLPVWKWLRALAEHEVHHRGQLYLMLRLLDVPTPPLYGLTSEEVRARSEPPPAPQRA